MDKLKDIEYIFWLDIWRDGSEIWPKLGHFKCSVTKNKIHVTADDNDSDKELNIDISAIKKCKLGYDAGTKSRIVQLFMDNKKFFLMPLHPLDPRGIQNLNHNEAAELIQVIEAFRSNIDPKVEPNPYLRQLAMKNNLKGFTIPDIQWDKHTSPWDYYDLYQKKHLDLKIFGQKMMLLIVIVPVVVLLILGLAYILDTLNII